MTNIADNAKLFGRTGVRVSPFILGGHEYLNDGRSRGFNEDMDLAVSRGYIGQGYGGPKRIDLLKTAYDLGINVFDVTIDSEKEALGRNLKDCPPPYDILVQTRPEGMCYGYDKNNLRFLDLDGLRTEVQRILGLIKRDTIDLFNVGLLAWSIDNDPQYMDKLSHNLATLKQEGLIRFCVADSFSGGRLYKAMMQSGAFDAINLDLNFADRCCLDETVPAAREQGLGIITREAFQKGTLFQIAAAAGIKDKALVARAALKWVRACRPDCIIIGADDGAQLQANVATNSTPLNEEEEAVLDTLREQPLFEKYFLRKKAKFMELASS